MEKKIERHVVPGVVHADGVRQDIYATNEQIGDLYIEYKNAQELENIKLMLARACGMPEPVLYDDELVGPTADDNEEKLSELLDLVEWDTIVMARINECNKHIDSLFQNLPWFKKLYTAWKQNKGLPVKFPLKEEDVRRFLTDKRNADHIAWCDRRSNLWDKRKIIQSKINKLAKENNLWPKYYELLNGDITAFNTFGRDDAQEEGKDNRQLSTDVAFSKAHVEENAPLQREYAKIDSLRIKNG